MFKDRYDEFKIYENIYYHLCSILSENDRDYGKKRAVIYDILDILDKLEKLKHNIKA